MVEWWEKANAALIAERAPIALIPEACAKANWMFRAQTERMFEICDNNHIPILVFSAGITDVIDEMIKQRILGGKELPYMHVISNKLRPDENGTIVGFEGSIIHVFNKNEHAVADAHVAWWDKVKKRKNAILLGDSPGDVRIQKKARNRKTPQKEQKKTSPPLAPLFFSFTMMMMMMCVFFNYHYSILDMADGLEDQHAILRIGFLNENVEAKLEAYKKLFDVVVTNDGPMDFVVDLLNEILAQKQE